MKMKMVMSMKRRNENISNENQRRINENGVATKRRKQWLNSAKRQHISHHIETSKGENSNEIYNEKISESRRKKYESSKANQ
jgi:hypothetical protein